MLDLSFLSKSRRRWRRHQQEPVASQIARPQRTPLLFLERVKERVYEGVREPFQDINLLKRRITRVWSRDIHVEAVRKAIEKFRPRIQCVVTMRAAL